MNEHPDVISCFIISDEATFALLASVNKQNMGYWSEANPYELHLKPVHSDKVTVWKVWNVLPAFGVSGSYFNEDEIGCQVPVTSHQDVCMVNEFLFPEFRFCYINIVTIWFQQDEVTAHTAQQSTNTVMNCI